jgi:hypothetical protein
MQNDTRIERLTQGRELYLAKLKSGEIVKSIQVNPIEKAKQNPGSLKLAIRAFCFDCMGQTVSWKNDVTNCTAPNCPLFNHRPQ